MFWKLWLGSDSKVDNLGTIDGCQGQAIWQKVQQRFSKFNASWLNEHIQNMKKGHYNIQKPCDSLY